MKRVYLIFTGGTIASKIAETGKVEASIPGDDLLKGIEGAGEIAKLETEEFSEVSGHTLTVEQLFKLAQRAKEVVQRVGISGLVITHGTAGLEESAFMADLVVHSQKPVVFTGAMYNASYQDTDGPRNLMNSIKVAVEPSARDMGVMVCLNGQIHAARDATKTHTTQLHTFSSFEHGILGQVDTDRVIFYRKPFQHPEIRFNRIEPNVDIIKAAIGMDSRFLYASMNAGARGIVIESLPGTGSVTLGMMKGIKDALKLGISVVITSRCPMGRAIPVYGGGCGSKDVAELGCIMAGDLAASKARVLLALALGTTRDLEEIRSLFLQFSL